MKMAAEWYRKAAEAGNSTAMGNLVICYAEGRGVTKSKTKAAEWRKKAEAAKKQGN
jgi:TPR repeat protein